MVDVAGSGGMFLSGLVFVTKNRCALVRTSYSEEDILMTAALRYIGWGNVLIAMSSWVNSHPMRTKEGGTGGSASVGYVRLLSPT
jgi:hypothetical protein